MSRATDGARPWSESAAQVGPRHMSLPPISLLIDAPRQSNSHLHTSSFAAIIATVATPDSHPDCRALLIKIVALQGGSTASINSALQRARATLAARYPQGRPMRRLQPDHAEVLLLERYMQAWHAASLDGFIELLRED